MQPRMIERLMASRVVGTKTKNKGNGSNYVNSTRLFYSQQNQLF